MKPLRSINHNKKNYNEISTYTHLIFVVAGPRQPQVEERYHNNSRAQLGEELDLRKSKFTKAAQSVVMVTSFDTVFDVAAMKIVTRIHMGRFPQDGNLP